MKRTMILLLIALFIFSFQEVGAQVRVTKDRNGSNLSFAGRDLTTQKDTKKYTSDEIKRLRIEADTFYNHNLYAAAAENYEIIYKANKANAFDLMSLGDCRYRIDENKQEALRYSLLAEEKIDSLDSIQKAFLYIQIATCYTFMKKDNSKQYYDKYANKSLTYAQRALECTQTDYFVFESNFLIAGYYYDKYQDIEKKGKYLGYARKYYNSALEAYCKYKKIKLSDAEKFIGKDTWIPKMLVNLLDCSYYLNEITEKEYHKTIKKYYKQFTKNKGSQRIKK